MRGAVAALLVAACGGQITVPSTPSPQTEFEIFAEGPCPRLSAQHALGTTVLVFGETGYDLHGWMPGEPVAAAQSLAEVVGDTVMLRPALSGGLPHDARGYVPGALEVDGGWLTRTTTRYARGGTGALFEKRASAYVWSNGRWAGRAGRPMGRLDPSSRLGELPAMCADGRQFIPTAHDTSPEGGVFVAGRCDDAAAPNPVDPVIHVAHGRPGARTWSTARIPETDELRGIVNLDLFARRDDEAYLVAYEPFVARDERKAFLAGYDGRHWRRIEVPVEDGFMGVSGTETELYLAAGRRFYQRAYGTATLPLAAVPLPLPAFAQVTASQMHVHAVRVLSGQVWVEASYRVQVPRKEGVDAIWASALYTRQRPRRLIYCDARESADQALAEVP